MPCSDVWTKAPTALCKLRKHGCYAASRDTTIFRAGRSKAPLRRAPDCRPEGNRSEDRQAKARLKWEAFRHEQLDHAVRIACAVRCLRRSSTRADATGT